MVDVEADGRAGEAEPIAPRSSALARGRSFDPPLQPADLGRQFAVGRVAQKRIDTALMLDRADRRGSHAQPDRADRVGQYRGLLQVGEKAALCLDVGMADIVPDLDTLAGDRASARHAAPRPDQPYENATRGRFLRTAHAVLYPFRARPVKARTGSR